MTRTPWIASLLAVSTVAQGADSPVAVGRAIFQAAGAAAGAESRAALFNASSCESCHRQGNGGAGPQADGPIPVALVIQLQSPAGAGGTEGAGDPVYGRVLNTAAGDGVRPEGAARVRYSEIEGHFYPEGFRWRMRVPHYELTQLSRGPLAPTTIIKPRLAPSLYGATLLEAVPDSAIADEAPGTRRVGEPAWRLYHGTKVLGRFGWQGESVSIRDQVTKAFARELGLTSPDQPNDDCTPAETDCVPRRRDAPPAVSDDSLNAVAAYLGTLRLTELRPGSPGHSARLALFVQLGCAACHRPELPVAVPAHAGEGLSPHVIAAYTDLRLHDLGADMDDLTVAGKRVSSKWRTAPLWGLAERVSDPESATLLHDGRARTVEEAILWHGGEAAEARRRFVGLMGSTRAALLRWLETL